MIDEKNVVGVIMNLMIFVLVLVKGNVYDSKVVELVVVGIGVIEVVFEIMMGDVVDVCELFVFVYVVSNGVDGWVLIEVELGFVYDVE